MLYLIQVSLKAMFSMQVLGGVLGSGIATAVFGAILLKRNKQVEAEVKAKFGEVMKVFESRRSWKEQAMSKLFGPMVMQFDRTQNAFRRWDKKNLYLEGKVVREGNLTNRDLLLSKGHLIPPALMPEASKLVQHYDAWLEEYDRLRSTPDETSKPAFVFVGPKGYPFPKESEAKLKEEFRRLQKDLYGV